MTEAQLFASLLAGLDAANKGPADALTAEEWCPVAHLRITQMRMKLRQLARAGRVECFEGVERESILTGKPYRTNAYRLVTP